MSFDWDELVQWTRIAVVGVITLSTVHIAYKIYTSMSHEKGRSHWRELAAAIGLIDPLVPTALSHSPLSICLDSCTVLTHNVALFRFRLPSPDQILGLRVGQHISIAAVVGGKRVVRSYSPTSSVDQRGYFEVVIKRYEGDHALSKHIHALKPDDTVEVSGPKGHIIYEGRGRFLTGRGEKRERRQFHTITFIAGGSGLTPFIQIIKSSLEDNSDCTSLHLIFANSTEKDVFFKDELDVLTSEHSRRFKVLYTVSKPEPGWPHKVGRADSAEILSTVAPPSPDHIVLLCGPNPMVKAVLTGLKSVNYDEKNIAIF